MSQRRAGMRTAAAVVTLATASLSLAGCASAASGDAGSGTKVTIASWYEDNVIGTSIDAANAALESDDITLEYTQIPLDQYNTWLSTQLASGEGPDIIMDGASFPARVAAGNLVDISDETVVTNFTEEGLALATDADGNVYGVPSYGWFSGVFYNKDLFEQAGVEVPTTFDEFLDASDKLKAADITPLAAGLADSDKAIHSLMGYLENAYYRNGEGSPEVDTDFAYGEATLDGNWNDPLEEWSKLIDHGVLTPEMVGVPLSQSLAEFTDGKAAMYISGAWDYQAIKDAGLDFGMFSHVGNAADNQWLLGGPAASMGVNVDSKNPDAAMKALEALASEDAMQAIVDANPGAFSYYNGVEGDFPAEYELVAPLLAEGHVAVGWDRWGVNMPAQTMLDTLTKGLQSVISGQQSTDDLIKQLDDQADSIRY
ncbi:ABC transporter substrate-binding protein [Naasia sp. SYSU D00057]|uniref:ABC transporter substrate-binding protein n=1 Tax=Naasia sp. SYSU D00057 TaxID=2817380 RepID=UPI001B300AF6|nr:extracellular solute-binding protein [Naasia sp. SYSU D00057]